SMSEWVCKFKSFNSVSGISSTEYYQVSEDELIGEGAINSLSSDNVRLATDEEIKRILTKVAKIKYPIGTTIINTYGEKVKLKQDNTIYSFHDHNQIYASFSDGLIYNDGVWAEIVKDPELIINGYDVVKDDNATVKIGCQQFHIHHIISMKSLLDNYGGTYVFTDNTKWTVDELNKILSVFD